jgi:uncharacterized protein YpiB (UPF0302 family)
MNPWISASVKKSFIEYFLRNYRFRNLEARRIFEFIISSPHLLSNIHFSETVHPNERNVEISTVCAQNTVPFKYYKGSASSSYSVAEAYNDLMRNPKAKTFLLLHFRGKQLNYKYQEMVKGSTREAQEAWELKNWSERVVQHSLMLGKLVEIYQSIDHSLEMGDKEAFFRLTNEKKRLEQEIEHLRFDNE